MQTDQILLWVLGSILLLVILLSFFICSIAKRLRQFYVDTQNQNDFMEKTLASILDRMIVMEIRLDERTRSVSQPRAITQQKRKYVRKKTSS
jgi:hypothetical protein